MDEHLDFLRAAAANAASASRRQKAALKLDSSQAAAQTASASSAAAAHYAETDCRLRAAAVLQQWAETDSADLAEGETLAQRLQALIIGAVDVDLDGELSDEESEVCDQLRDVAWDYLLSKGVADEDCEHLLNTFEDDSADRVHDLLLAALPDGEDAALADLDAFAFGDEAQQALFDNTYRKRVVFRNGQKKRINQRISGYVRLSAKQKLALRKAQRKSHSGLAQARRLKSMNRRTRAGF